MDVVAPAPLVGILAALTLVVAARVEGGGGGDQVHRVRVHALQRFQVVHVEDRAGSEVELGHSVSFCLGGNVEVRLRKAVARLRRIVLALHKSWLRQLGSSMFFTIQSANSATDSASSALA